MHEHFGRGAVAQDGPRGVEARDVDVLCEYAHGFFFFFFYIFLPQIVCMYTRVGRRWDLARANVYGGSMERKRTVAVIVHRA